MAKFRYIGDSGLPQVILKLTFTREDWTEVPDELVERLSSHSHLEQKKERAARSDDASDESETDGEPKRRGRPPKAPEA